MPLTAKQEAARQAAVAKRNAKLKADAERKKAFQAKQKAARDAAVAKKNARTKANADRKKAFDAKQEAARQQAIKKKAKLDARDPKQAVNAAKKKVAAAGGLGTKAGRAQAKASAAHRVAQGYAVGSTRGKAMKKASRLQKKADRKISRTGNFKGAYGGGNGKK